MKILELPKFQLLIQNKILKNFYNPSATNIIFNIINNNQINTIAVPAFICEEIHLTFLSSNKSIKYYDVDTNMQPVLNKSHYSCDCLFLCDYFGIPLIENPYLNSFIKDTKKIIIFDRCHSLFSGTNKEVNTNIFFRKNIYFVYSLRKFLPTINGGMMFCHEDTDLIDFDNIISSKNSKYKSYLSIYIKRVFQNNSLFQYAMARRYENKLLKKDHLLGYKINEPELSYKELDYLNYYNRVLDKDIFKWLEIEKLSKIEKNRRHSLKLIHNFFEKNEKFKIINDNINFEEYGIPYGYIIDIEHVFLKEIIEAELVKPLLNVLKDLDVILWPYNTMDKFQIFKIKLKSKLLILPRIKT